MDFREIVLEGADWIDVGNDRDLWQVIATMRNFVTAVHNVDNLHTHRIIRSERKRNNN
jgi:hypothetical protein